ncbi:MAG: hypothetical protein KJZ65_08600 [Phycisphaerales bacterium]|nr:hypothetical protein [Phycisphaerales bacterium]
MGTPLEQARAVLRRHRLGRLVASHPDGIETRAEDARFIIEGSTGRLVFSVTRVLLELGEHTLFVPDETAPGDEDTLEMVVEMAHEPPVPEVLRDRHLAYHGHVRGGVWVWMEVLSGRLEDNLFDGDDLMQPNPLAGCESRLCRACNQMGPRLVEACRRRFGTVLGSATVVGVDAHGLDVRLVHGVRRIEFGYPAESEEEALRLIHEALDPGESL